MADRNPHQAKFNWLSGWMDLEPNKERWPAHDGRILYSDKNDNGRVYLVDHDGNKEAIGFSNKNTSGRPYGLVGAYSGWSYGVDAYGLDVPANTTGSPVYGWWLFYTNDNPNYSKFEGISQHNNDGFLVDYDGLNAAEQIIIQKTGWYDVTMDSYVYRMSGSAPASGFVVAGAGVTKPNLDVISFTQLNPSWNWVEMANASVGLHKIATHSVYLEEGDEFWIKVSNFFPALSSATINYTTGLNITLK